LVVPEIRGKRGGRTIRLAVAIVPAASRNPASDPVVFMSGGPGGPALSSAQDLVNMGLNGDRELIIMDQRGVGSSRPALDCRETARFRTRSIGLRYDAASIGRLLVNAAAACRRRLARKGIDLSAYNTTENAADFAALRVTLGIRSWNVYSASYGTDLALVYTHRYPAGVRSVIIDSVVPPDVASLGWTWTSVKRGVDNLFAACAHQPLCDRRYPHLARTFTRLVRKLEAHPVTTRAKVGGRQVKVVLDGGALVNWLQQHTLVPADIPADIYALARGSARPVAAFFAPLQASEPLSRGMHFSVICSEWVPYEPPSQVLRDGRRVFPDYPTSVLRQPPALPFMTQVCGAWKVHKAPKAIRARVLSTIPTLSIGGSFDAVTGTQWARYAVRKFPHATYINIPGVSHFVGLDSPCTQHVISTFLASPNAPDTGCVKALKPAPFTITTTRPPASLPAADDGPL
jgi:pimeloyl-ACP methyl ester carboxylesterase